MRFAVVAALLVTVIPTLAIAQGGVLGAYADASGLECNIIDSAPGLLIIYFVHTNTTGATGIQFSAPIPPCLNASFLSGTFPTCVGTQNGIACSYGACLTGPIHSL